MTKINASTAAKGLSYDTFGFQHPTKTVTTNFVDKQFETGDTTNANMQESNNVHKIEA